MNLSSKIRKSFYVDALSQLLFPSYKHKFSLINTLPRIISNRKSYSETSNRMEYLTFISFTENMISSESNRKPLYGEDASNIFTEAYNNKAGDNKLVESYYYNYKIHDGFWKILINELSRAQKKGIRIVVWIPTDHKAFKSLIYPKYYIDKLFIEKLKALLVSEKIPLFDANSISERCDYWRDSIHIHPKCYPLIADEILKIGFE
ncbi:MAG: DUF1574 family protein [Leptospiraceae bacterium]|nr:DUF1574 family protein [Leptospiraceae bacterium]